MINCWSAEPHQFISGIVSKNIDQNRKQWIETLFSIWESEETSFFNVSVWHDSIRKDTNLFGPWHYTNIPFVDVGFRLNPREKYNITGAITSMIDCMMNKSTTSLWALAFSFRSLFHFVADSHCPFHSIAYFSNKYPNGDNGGNKIHLNDTTIPKSYRDLHSLWDTALLKYRYSVFYSENIDGFNKNLSELLNSYPETSFTNIKSSPDQWSVEAYNIAVQYGYTPLINMSYLPNNYINDGFLQAKRLIVLAGHRLNYIMNGFFDHRDISSILNPMKMHEYILWGINSTLFILVLVYMYIIHFKKDTKYDEQSSTLFIPL